MTTSKRPNPALTAEQSARIVAGMKVLNKTAQAPAPAAADASWDAVHADTAKRMGVELVEGDIKKAERAAAAARVTTSAGDAWDDVVAQTNASHGFKPSSL